MGRLLGPLALILTVAGCSSKASRPAAVSSSPPAAIATESAPPSVGGAPSIAPAGAMRWTFDGDTAGGLPGGARVFAGTWAVRGEPGAPSAPNALCQTGQAEFPAVGMSDTSYTNFSMLARFKPISGRTDQAAGLIFRVQDANNFYIFRANALENNANLYRYRNGKRTIIKEGSAKVSRGVWQDIRVDATGGDLKGFVNGSLVVQITDAGFDTGGVGLWTKADSVTCFDDVSVVPS